jgi:hypothetical protein
VQSKPPLVITICHRPLHRILAIAASGRKHDFKPLEPGDLWQFMNSNFVVLLSRDRIANTMHADQSVRPCSSVTILWPHIRVFIVSADMSIYYGHTLMRKESIAGVRRVRNKHGEHVTLISRNPGETNLKFFDHMQTDEFFDRWLTSLPDMHNGPGASA